MIYESQVKDIGGQVKSTMMRISALDDRVTKGAKLESNPSSESQKATAAATKAANEAALKSSSAIKEAEKAAARADEAQRAAQKAGEMVKAVVRMIMNNTTHCILIFAYSKMAII